MKSYQSRVWEWMLECFGSVIPGNIKERSHRFLEEALELVQASGCTVHEAHQLVDYVFARPVGEFGQEVGGVKVTLAALCEAKGVNEEEAGETELARVWTKVDQIREKQRSKPEFSALPSPYPERPHPKPFDPTCWIRTYQGTPDWAEDCISTDGTGILDGYEGNAYGMVGLVSMGMLHVARFHLGLALQCWKHEADQGDGINEEFIEAYNTAKAFLDSMPKPIVESTILINGWQLREALDFVNPDGDRDRDQLETSLTIGHFANGHSGPGLYASFDDYPEEGATFLPEIPTHEQQIATSLHPFSLIIPHEGSLYFHLSADALRSAAAAHPDYWDGESGTDKPNILVTDPEDFAEAVARELNHEDEAGHSMLTRLLDKGIAKAIESGCDGAEIPSHTAPTVTQTQLALCLVGDTEHITEEIIRQWTPEQRLQARDWAWATHVHASDNPDVVVPSRPDFTQADYRPTKSCSNCGKSLPEGCGGRLIADGPGCQLSDITPEAGS